ncbi:MAG: penicillin-binding protein [Sphingobacteriales bacterium]|nr:penicillin-binding protein [Sphingobacteriales bacterium]
MKNNSLSEQKVLFRKIVKWLWIISGASVGLFLLIFLLINLGIFGKLPDTTQLENPETPLATEIFTEDGQLLGKFFDENRSAVSYDEISQYMFQALIATEDIRFEKHAGVDLKGTMAIPFYLLRGKKKGASTITQQLAKNLFPRTRFKTIPEKIVRKLKEWVIAIRLERYYTKEEIITMYLNTVDFGSNAYGIKSAARTFFNKTPLELNIQECATLIGVLKATKMYSPYFNPENSRNRRNVVLNQMKKYKFISREQYDSLSSLPIVLDYQVESHNTGMATYFREELRKELSEWCKENGYDLYSSGLRIYTTINSKMQQYAEEAVRQHMQDLQKQFFEHWAGIDKAPFDRTLSKKDIENLMIMAVKRTDRYRMLKKDGKTWDEILADFNKKRNMKLFSYEKEFYKEISPWDSIYYYKFFLQPGFMAMDPTTGHVKAWVGGIDYRYFKYDHVKQARRQVGSTFKPFVYTTAIVNGFSPCMKVPNVPVIFPEFNNWQPKNSDGKYGGEMSLKTGLAKSINCITAWVMKQVGPEAVVELISKMGIDTSYVDPYPSISLGTPDISLYEMVGAFNTYANKGVWVEPVYTLRIEDKDGNVLFEKVPKEVEVLDEATNYVMVNMLQAVAGPGGTAVRLRFRYNVNMPLGGKTGTTQNNSDGWFIGFTPQLTAGAWVGAEDRSVHFRYMSMGQGASTALPIFAYFITKVYNDPTLGYKPIDFEKPEGELPLEIDCSAYSKETEEFTGY